MPLVVPCLERQQISHGTPQTDMSSALNEPVRKTIPLEIVDLKMKKFAFAKQAVNFRNSKRKKRVDCKSDLKDPFGCFEPANPQDEPKLCLIWEDSPKNLLVEPSMESELFSCDQSSISKLCEPIKFSRTSKISKTKVKNSLKILRPENNGRLTSFQNASFQRGKIVSAFQKTSTVLMDYEKAQFDKDTSEFCESWQDLNLLSPEFLLGLENWEKPDYGKRDSGLHVFFERIYKKWKNGNKLKISVFKKVVCARKDSECIYTFRERVLSGKNILRRTGRDN